MAYNRYQGNTGRVERVGEGRDEKTTGERSGFPIPDKPLYAPQPKKIKPPSPLSGLGNSLGGILSKIGADGFETEDLILMLILYLMYRESGDDELLMILAGMFFL